MRRAPLVTAGLAVTIAQRYGRRSKDDAGHVIRAQRAGDVGAAAHARLTAAADQADWL